MPLINQTFSQIITFTRSSGATYFDATGTLQTAATDVPRFDYNPSTLAARGFLVEEQRTNGIRNNTMQGAVAGGAGTFPTNWAASLSGSGVTQEITAVGTENGIAYVDVRYFGTPTAGTNVAVAFEPANQIAAASGQTWVESVFLKLQAGSFNNTSTTLSLLGTDGVNGTESITSSVITSTPSNLRESRISVSGTFANALTTRAQPRIRIGYTVGVAFDITLRIGLPQLEQGAFATSVIPTVNAFALGVTREADVASVNTLSPWFNSTTGTIYVEFLRNTTPAASTFPQFVNIDDGSVNNRLALSTNSSRNLRGQVAIAGVFTTIATANAYTEGAVSKLALGYQALNHAVVANGGTAATDTSVNVPSGLTTMRLGDQSGGAGNANGYLRRIVYYPTRLSNAQLQAITA